MERSRPGKNEPSADVAAGAVQAGRFQAFVQVPQPKCLVNLLFNQQPLAPPVVLAYQQRKLPMVAENRATELLS